MDLWKSSKVTDTGLLHFLGHKPSDNMELNHIQRSRGSSNCTQSQQNVSKCKLRRVLLKETNVSSAGLLGLIEECSELEYLEYSKGTLEDELLQLLNINYAKTSRDKCIGSSCVSW